MRDRTNPFEGRPGFWNRVNQMLYPFTGPAQVGIGIGKTERPYSAPVDPSCPICGRPLADHAIERGDATTPTYLNCPSWGLPA